MRSVLFCLLVVLGVVQGYSQAEVPWKASQKAVEKSSRRQGFNFDESQVPNYSLPSPLVADDGSVVKTAKEWNDTRREEIINLFRDQVYGRRPDTPFTMEFEQIAMIENAIGGKAIGRSIVATVFIGSRSYSWPFVLFVPRQAERPVPAIILINNRYFVPLEKASTEYDPFWSVEQIIDRGYATASFHTSDVDPDKKDGYADGLRSFFANGKAPEDNAWRSLSAWGWAASRILDYLEEDSAVDASRVAVVGHSRGGKTSLWAAAEDMRFAIGYSNNSGCGGAALSRRAYGETVARITTNFPHWFSAKFAAYGGREDELPVDQHELMSLIAPRGIYIASADEDLWADPKGEYASLVEAAPVFTLLGKSSITQADMPSLNHPCIVGQTGYHIRSHEHDLKHQDWTWFLDFSDTLLKK